MEYIIIYPNLLALLLSRNVAPQVVQKQAGHSTITTTMDVYGHLMLSVYNSSIDELDNVFEEKTELKKQNKFRCGSSSMRFCFEVHISFV